MSVIFISLSNGLATINIDVDGSIYGWTVGGLDGIEDVPAHLAVNADVYRGDIRTALAMGQVLSVVTPPTLEESREAKLAQIRAACGAALDPLAAAYPDREVQSWPQQIAEATTLEADPNAAAPLIRQMAAVRPSLGDADADRVTELARRIRANAAAWSAIAGPIIGKRQALEDAVLAAYEAQDQAAIEAIVVDFGGAA